MSVFTATEVTQLAAHQMSGRYHPYTCANRGDGNHRDVYGDLGALVPTIRGWICPFCDYTQEWAHGTGSDKPTEPANGGAVQNKGE